MTTTKQNKSIYKKESNNSSHKPSKIFTHVFVFIKINKWVATTIQTVWWNPPGHSFY